MGPVRLHPRKISETCRDCSSIRSSSVHILYYYTYTVYAHLYVYTRARCSRKVKITTYLLHPGGQTASTLVRDVHPSDLQK